MTNNPENGVLGGLRRSVIGLFVAQLVVGVILAFSYHPNIAGAYDSVTQIRASGFGHFVANFHYWGSALLLILTMGLLLVGLGTKGYQNPIRWYGFMLAAVLAFLFQLTGNVLPADHHGIQTVVVEGGITRNAPMVGAEMSNLMMGGHAFSEGTFALWWQGHAYLLPALAVVAVILLWERADGFRKCFPTYAVACVLTAVVAVAVSAPRGNAATADDMAQYAAHVSWYTWPLHGSMTLFEQLNPSLGWVGAMVVPGIVFVLLALLPWMRNRVTPFAAQLGAFVVFAFFVGSGLAYGGRPAAIVGNRDPVAAPMDPNMAMPKTADAATKALIAKGLIAFNTAGCSDCHGKNGANGDSGPNLTKEWQKHTDSAWFISYVKNPKSIDPSSTMPAFPNLSADDYTSLGTFLANPAP